MQNKISSTISIAFVLNQPGGGKDIINDPGTDLGRAIFPGAGSMEGFILLSFAIAALALLWVKRYRVKAKIGLLLLILLILYAFI